MSEDVNDDALGVEEEQVFRFDAEKHQYWLGDTRLPSVTEVLRDTGLLSPYADGDSYFAERGTAVHRAVHLELEGRLDPAGLEAIYPYIERFRLVRDLLDLEKPILAEEPRYNPVELYAGTIDYFGVSKALGGGTHVLLDWKTGQDMPAYTLQLGAYAGLLLDRYPQRAAVVMLSDYPPKVRWITPKTLMEARATFLCALTIYNWKRNHVR